MTYEDFAKKFIETACEEQVEEESLNYRQAASLAWQAFRRLMVEKGLQVSMADPIQGDYDGNTEDHTD